MSTVTTVHFMIDTSKKSPYIINFPQIGDSSVGYISVTEQNVLIPFEIKRIFWTYFTPESVVRGRHAHFETEQVLVAAAGRIIITTEDAFGNINIFTLSDPYKGVYIPPNIWHTMQYTHNAIQLAFASTEFNKNDYIREYEEFKKTWGREE